MAYLFGYLIVMALWIVFDFTVVIKWEAKNKQNWEN